LSLYPEHNPAILSTTGSSESAGGEPDRVLGDRAGSETAAGGVFYETYFTYMS